MVGKGEKAWSQNGQIDIKGYRATGGWGVGRTPGVGGARTAKFIILCDESGREDPRGGGTSLNNRG